MRPGDAAAQSGSTALAPTPVKSTAYTASPGDFVPVDASAGSVTITLPTAPPDQAQVGCEAIAIANPHLVIVSCGGADVLNQAGGAATLDLSALGQGTVLQYDKSSAIWYALADDTPIDVPRGAAKLGSDGTVGGPGGSSLTAVAYPENYGAKGDAATDDTAALVSWIASGKALALTPGKTYMHQHSLDMTTAGQVLNGNGATLRRTPQAITTTTTSITSGSTSQITVAATSGGTGASAWQLKVGDQIVVEQGGNFDPAARQISSISGKQVTIQGTFGITLSGTINVRHGWNQFAIHAEGCRVSDTVLDGNSAAWSWARWQHTAALVTYGATTSSGRTLIEHCRIVDQYGDGCTPASADVDFVFNSVENIKGRGFVFAGDVGNPTNFPCRVLHNSFLTCNGDTSVGGNDGLGSIGFSQGGPSALLQGNYVNGGVDGVSGLKSTNNGNATIDGNEFWDLSGYAVNGTGGGGESTESVIVSNNRCYGCGIAINNAGSSTTVLGWNIHDNELVDGAIHVSTGQDVDIHDNIFRAYLLSPPQAVDATAVSGGGRFGAGTVYYVVTATSSAGETTGSAEASARVTAGGSVRLAWSIVGGANGYKVYRAWSPGGETKSPALVATLAGPTNTSYLDTGAAPGSGAAPTSNTTWLQDLTLIVIGVTGGSAAGIRVHDNILDGGQIGIQVTTGSSTVDVSDNTLTNQYKSAISVTAIGLSAIRVRGNTIVSSGTPKGPAHFTDGISTYSGEVDGNVIDVSAGGQAGVAVYGSNQIVHNNQVTRGTNTSAATILVAGSASGAFVKSNTLDHMYTDSGKGTVKTGNRVSSGALSGQTALAAGAVTVSTAEVQSGDSVLLTNIGAQGTVGVLAVGKITAGSRFVITSSSDADTSTVFWKIDH